jgi:hypothetical protein
MLYFHLIGWIPVDSGCRSPYGGCLPHHVVHDMKVALSSVYGQLTNYTAWKFSLYPVRIFNCDAARKMKHRDGTGGIQHSSLEAVVQGESLSGGQFLTIKCSCPGETKSDPLFFTNTDDRGHAERRRLNDVEQ